MANMPVKLHRHVTYWKAGMRPKPGTIIHVNAGGDVVIRVGRHDTSGAGGIQYETYGVVAGTGIQRRTAATQTNVYSTT